MGADIEMVELLGSKWVFELLCFEGHVQGLVPHQVNNMRRVDIHGCAQNLVA